jgi:glycosyltransferase involved in cell wall biosynthesis
VLDNCSTDGTLEWLHSLSDARIILIESQKSLDIEESWRRITAIPKNKFITLIGHDDLLHPHYLEEMDRLIAAYPDASLYQAHFNLIDQHGIQIRKCKLMAEKEDAASFLLQVLRNRFDVYGTGFMLRSESYDAVGGIPDYPNLLFADFELWMKMTLKSYKATTLRECFSYRIHQSTTKVSSNKKMQEAFRRFVNFMVSLKSDTQLNHVIENESLPFLATYCKALSHRLLRTPLQEREALSVKKIIIDFRDYAELLAPGKAFQPNANPSVKLAMLIDSNLFTRKLFLLFKRVYPKPFLK